MRYEKNEFFFHEVEVRNVGLLKFFRGHEAFNESEPSSMLFIYNSALTEQKKTCAKLFQVKCQQRWKEPRLFYFVDFLFITLPRTAMSPSSRTKDASWRFIFTALSGRHIRLVRRPEGTIVEDLSNCAIRSVTTQAWRTGQDVITTPTRPYIS